MHSPNLAEPRLYYAIHVAQFVFWLTMRHGKCEIGLTPQLRATRPAIGMITSAAAVPPPFYMIVEFRDCWLVPIRLLPRISQPAEKDVLRLALQPPAGADGLPLYREASASPERGPSSAVCMYLDIPDELLILNARNSFSAHFWHTRRR